MSTPALTIASAIQAMKKRKIQFEPGLTNAEISAAEARFSIRFPADLRAFLQTELPVGDKFPHWRKALTDKKESDSIRERMRWPLEGILFDVEMNQFWHAQFGQKPATLAECKALVTNFAKAQIALIPIYSHRYTPSSPQAGNPVFSIHQTDIIVYGATLLEYLNDEFALRLASPASNLQHVPFWSDLL